jgi:hypothetical protein
MIIIRLQLAVSNSVNVKVKQLEYFRRFFGGDYYKGKQLYVGITPLHLHRLALICLRFRFRDTLASLTVKNYFSRNKMGIKIPLFIKSGALKNNTKNPTFFYDFPQYNPTVFFL